LFSAFEDLRRQGHNAHHAQPCVNLDQRGNVCFIVLERVDIAFRSYLDEPLVEVLSTNDCPARATEPAPASVGSATMREWM
jgi:hypothetical protein